MTCDFQQCGFLTSKDSDKPLQPPFKLVLVPLDKAANNNVVVCRLYYINSLKRELVDTNAYKLQPSLSRRVIVDGHGCHTALHFGVKA